MTAVCHIVHEKSSGADYWASANSQNWSSIRTIQSKVCFNQFLFCYILFYNMLTKKHCISKKRATFLDSFITVRFKHT